MSKTFKEYFIESKVAKNGRPCFLNNTNVAFSEFRSIFNNLFSCSFSVSDALTEDDDQENPVDVSNATCAAIQTGTISPEDALAGALADLAVLAASTGYKATVNDYVKDQFVARIVEAAAEAGVDINKNSLFVSELSDRVNSLGLAKRPTKNDLATFAKREGVSPNTDTYKKFIDKLDETLAVAGTEIVNPVENMVANCIGSLGKVVRLPACLDESKEGKCFRTACEKFYKKYPSKIEINDNSIGDVRQFLADMNDYVNYAKAARKRTFKMNNKIYRLDSIFPNLELLNALVN